jgi:hypothetical protein
MWEMYFSTAKEGDIKRSTPILDQQTLPTPFEPVRRPSATQDPNFDGEVIVIPSRYSSPAEYRASERGSPSSQSFRSDTESLETTIPQSNSNHKTKADTEVDEDLDRKKLILEEERFENIAEAQMDGKECEEISVAIEKYHLSGDATCKASQPRWQNLAF